MATSEFLRIQDGSLVNIRHIIHIKVERKVSHCSPSEGPPISKVYYDITCLCTGRQVNQLRLKKCESKEEASLVMEQLSNRLGLHLHDQDGGLILG